MPITLPKQFEDWAKAEVAAGRAESVEALAERALETHRLSVERFRASLDQAVGEADRDGWIDGDTFFAEMAALSAELERDAESAS